MPKIQLDEIEKLVLDVIYYGSPSSLERIKAVVEKTMHPTDPLAVAQTLKDLMEYCLITSVTQNEKMYILTLLGLKVVFQAKTEEFLREFPWNP